MKRQGYGGAFSPSSMPAAQAGERQSHADNPFSLSDSMKKDGGANWLNGIGAGLGAGLGGGFNNLNQLDEATLRKINDEYTRQDQSSDYQTRDQTEAVGTVLVASRGAKLQSTASSREPGDFLADEVALLMRSEQKQNNYHPKDLNTVKFRSDE